MQLADTVEFDVEDDDGTVARTMDLSTDVKRVYDSKRLTIRYAVYDTVAALLIAFMINATILIVGASAFFKNGKTDVDQIGDAYAELVKFVGKGAGVIFAVALLVSG